MNTDLTKGKVLNVLLKFLIPFFIANLLQALYGGVDLFVVGRFNTSSATSAVNIGSQLMQLISSFIIGCSMGITVIMGKYIGSSDQNRSYKAYKSAIFLFLLFGIVITPIIFFSSSVLVNLVKTPTEAVEEAIMYERICSLGIPFIILFNVISSVMRAYGDSKTPMFIVLIACIFNITFDFLFAGAFKLGVMGVAIATTLAQLISSVIGFIILKKKNYLLIETNEKIKPSKIEMKKIISVGLPIALQDMLISVSFMILTSIANLRSLDSSAAVGVVEKIIMFMFILPSSMLSALSAFTAQNYGAGKIDRAKEALRWGIIICVSFGSLMCLMSEIMPNTLARIFSKDEEVIKVASSYLRSYSIDCILVGFTFCINGYLCGINKSIVTFIHNVISIFLVRIPAAYLFSKCFKDTMFPMGLASPLGSLLSIIILLAYFKIFSKNKVKRLH